ncbi:uncharacterized protein LOC141648702 [Silene latifolia]|uniref:uncharacterized protein LOC141648702 n=1 Tax=Silene latifolia TaxID=37657 RepID=UPI003D77D3CE
MTAAKTKSSSFSQNHTTKNSKNSNKFDLLSSTSAEEFPALSKNHGPSSVDVQKEKSLGEINGIPPLNLETLVEDVAKEEEEEMASSVPSPSVLAVIEEEPSGMLQFTEEEVKKELEYWRNYVCCFILGANPPWEIVDGFIRRLWQNYQVDKISFLPNGVFLVRFKTRQAYEAVLKQGHFLFDNKPLIVKPWSPEVELVKHEVKSVPIWVKFHRLPLKFWGKGIARISSLLGEFIKCDPATEDKTRIGYARAIIEVGFGTDLPEKVRFLDEHGETVEIDVEFEWKPVVCSGCKGIWHKVADCRRSKKKPVNQGAAQKPQSKVWRPKPKQPEPPQKQSKTTQSLQKGKEVAHTPNVPTQPGTQVEIQLKTPVVWLNSGKYTMGPTPMRPVMRLSRQECIEGAYSVHTFGQHTFLEALNTSATPKEGIGISGSVSHPGVVTLLSSHAHHQLIHLELLHHGSNQTVHITFIHGSNDAGVREGLWNELMGLRNSVTNWIILGDFNIVRAMEERIGPNPPSLAEILAFNQCLLDWISDHSPMLGSIQDAYTPKRRFSYLNCWEEHQHYSSTILHAWDITVRGTAMFRLFGKLKNVKRNLITLHKNHFSDISKRVKQAHDDLTGCQTQIQLSPLDAHLLDREKQLLEKYLLLRKTERSSLLQRAKLKDIQYNDAPNSYFFSRIAARKNQSIVGNILDHTGRAREGTQEVNQAFVEYYQSLLGQTSPISPIDEALLEGPTSPGHDGFSAQFFKKNWEIIHPEFCSAIQEFFLKGKLSKTANTTLLALIPKKPVVQTVMDYRPIAYCTVLYKTVSKILCERLKPLLPILVGKEQGAFVAGRSIFQNIMLTQSLIKGGDTPSVATVTQSLDYIAQISGLKANPEKTNIYMGGVRADVKQDILRDIGYVEGSFPFRYLGKVNLINTVIFGLEQFWCSTLLIPKGVIKQITKFCRNFLWNTDEGTKKLIMKSWASCCKPVHEGGFNIKEVLAWNKCLISKWIWEIDQHSESFWKT